MTSEYERGHAAGREAGIREAVAVFDGLWRENTGYTRAQMIALLDAPAPAGVTVQDLPPLTADEKARPRNFASEMDIRNAAMVLLECKTVKAMTAAGKPLDLVAALRALSEGST